MDLHVLDMSDADALSMFMAAHVRQERERAEFMGAFSAIEGVLRGCELHKQARGLREGPMAKSGARSHRAWRDRLASQKELMAPFATMMGVVIACDYWKLAKEPDATVPTGTV